jgi:hypothetical protein
LLEGRTNSEEEDGEDTLELRDAKGKPVVIE